MPKPPNRGRTSVSAANLEQLGAATLAAFLVDRGRYDRTLREALTRLLAEAAGEAELHDYVDRRLLALTRGRRLDREGAKVLWRELEALRTSTVDIVAAQNEAAAIGLLRHMIDLGPAILNRVPPPHEQAVAWQAGVLADLARLWGGNPPPDPEDLVAFVVACCVRDDDVLTKAATILAPVLGDAGLQLLRSRLQVEMEILPTEPLGGRWQTSGGQARAAQMRAWRLRRSLGEIADLLGDVDGYIALERAQPRAQVNVRAIVERLLKAGRGDEALAWLDDARHQNRLIATLDQRLAALELVGRGEEAQALRWQGFERQLDGNLLRDYLKRMPDFEDFEAERRAMEQVRGHKSVTDALVFLVAWPDLDSAAGLVRERFQELGATPPETLFAIADALRQSHPHESVAATRIAVRAVLQRMLSRLFERAARALLDCAVLEPPPWLGSEPEPHDAFVDRLRTLYPRHWEFWRVVDSPGH